MAPGWAAGRAAAGGAEQAPGVEPAPESERAPGVAQAPEQAQAPEVAQAPGQEQAPGQAQAPGLEQALEPAQGPGPAADWVLVRGQVSQRVLAWEQEAGQARATVCDRRASGRHPRSPRQPARPVPRRPGASVAALVAARVAGGRSAMRPTRRCPTDPPPPGRGPFGPIPFGRRRCCPATRTRHR